MRQDEFKRHESQARGIIDALRHTSQDEQVSSDFLERLRTKMDALPPPRPKFFNLRHMWQGWLVPRQLGFAMVLLLAFILGGVPQYITIFETDTTGLSAAKQKKLWDIPDNFSCAAELTSKSKNYASIESEHLHASILGCPTGDLLVQVAPPGKPNSGRFEWVQGPYQRDSASFVSNAVAATERVPADWLMARISVVLCQRWTDRSRTQIKRRVQMIDGSCRDQVIDVRTGRLIRSRPAPCDTSC